MNLKQMSGKQVSDTVMELLASDQSRQFIRACFQHPAKAQEIFDKADTAKGDTSAIWRETERLRIKNRWRMRKIAASGTC